MKVSKFSSNTIINSLLKGMCWLETVCAARVLFLSMWSSITAMNKATILSAQTKFFHSKQTYGAGKFQNRHNANIIQEHWHSCLCTAYEGLKKKDTPTLSTVISNLMFPVCSAPLCANSPVIKKVMFHRLLLMLKSKHSQILLKVLATPTRCICKCNTLQHSSSGLVNCSSLSSTLCLATQYKKRKD